MLRTCEEMLRNGSPAVQNAAAALLVNVVEIYADHLLASGVVERLVDTVVRCLSDGADEVSAAWRAQARTARTRRMRRRGAAR